VSHETADAFGITISVRNGVAHLEVTGAVDDDAAPTLEHLLTRLPEADVRSVVIDLTRTSAVSEEAQRTVDASLDDLRRHGGSAEVHAVAG
jgi:anti-anti-sigma regulatory factor